MRRFNVSVTESQYAWMKRNPHVSPSGLLQKAINDLMATGLDHRPRFLQELEERLAKLNWKWRPRVVVDDLRHPVAGRYPVEELDYLVARLSEFCKESRKHERPPGPATFPHPVLRGNQFAEVSLTKAPDGFKKPVVELLSMRGGLPVIENAVAEEFPGSEPSEKILRGMRRRRG